MAYALTSFALYRKLGAAQRELALREADIIRIAARCPGDSAVDIIRNRLFATLLRLTQRPAAENFLLLHPTPSGVEQEVLENILARDLHAIGFVRSTTNNSTSKAASLNDMAALNYLADLLKRPHREAAHGRRKLDTIILPKLGSSASSSVHTSNTTLALSDSPLARATNARLVTSSVAAALESSSRPSSVASTLIMPQLNKPHKSKSFNDVSEGRLEMEDEETVIKRHERMLKTKNEADVRQLIQENITLRTQNDRLHQELTGLRTLINDSSTPADIRRVLFIKAKNYQLERQVISQNEMLHRKRGLLKEVWEGLADIEGLLSETFNSQNRSPQKESNLKMVTVDRDEETARKVTLRALIKLRNSIKTRWLDRYETDSHNAHSNDQLSHELLSPFIIDRAHNTVTITDICHGDIRSFLNLQHITTLEENLAKLFVNLTALDTELNIVYDQTRGITSEAKKRVNYTLENGSNALKQSLIMLTSLAVLIPAAPLPEIHKVVTPNAPVLPDAKTLVTQLTEGSSISSTLRTKIEIRCTEVLKCIQVFLSMHDMKYNVLESELAFHKSLYSKQNDHVDQLTNHLDKCRCELRTSVQDILGVLRDLQTGLDDLKTAYTNEGALEMLKIVDKTVEQVCSTLDRLRDSHAITLSSEPATSEENDSTSTPSVSVSLSSLPSDQPSSNAAMNSEQ